MASTADPRTRGGPAGGERDATPVVIYGANWCADCRRSKRLLDRLGVAYEWLDLEARPELAEEVTRRNDGMQVIPTLVFPDGSQLAEPSDAELSRRLTELGLVS